MCRQHGQTQIPQLQVPNDLWVQQAHYIRQGRRPKARRKLLGYHHTANLVAAFQHQHLLACPGKVGAAGQAVVAAANNNDIVFSSTHDRVPYALEKLCCCNMLASPVPSPYT